MSEHRCGDDKVKRTGRISERRIGLIESKGARPMLAIPLDQALVDVGTGSAIPSIDR